MVRRPATGASLDPPVERVRTDRASAPVGVLLRGEDLDALDRGVSNLSKEGDGVVEKFVEPAAVVGEIAGALDRDAPGAGVQEDLALPPERGAQRTERAEPPPSLRVEHLPHPGLGRS